jgi:RNA polymerase sigma-70 factor, ECF subfamily
MEPFRALVARVRMSPATPNAEPLTPDDADLVRRLDGGDTEAAQALYQRHVAGLLRFAVAICGCRQTAEDAVHDTFIELLRHPGRFDSRRGSLGAYLYSIARHRMARIARTSRRSVQLEPEEPREPLGEPQSAATSDRLLTTEDEAERSHAIAQVRAAILALPLLHREVIALCDLEELPYADVALILNCPVGTVRSRLHRARAQLAQQLQVSGTLDRSNAKRIAHAAIEAPAEADSLLTCRGSVS